MNTRNHDLLMAFAKYGLFVLLGIFNVFWDVITLPIYIIIQHPWTTRTNAKMLRSKMVSNPGPETVTYEALPCKNIIATRLKDLPGANVFPKILDFIRDNYPDRNCVGTRSIKSTKMEIDEETGEKVEKYIMDTVFKWKTYDQFYEQVLNFGKGLHSLKFTHEDKILICCETCSNWLVSCYGSFLFGHVVVAVSTQLLNISINKIISETSPKIIIVSNLRLTTLCDIWKEFGMAPSVSHVIVIEDSGMGIDQEVTNFLDEEICTMIHVEKFIKKGKNHIVTPPNIRPEDQALIVYTPGASDEPIGTVFTHYNLFSALLSSSFWYESNFSKYESEICYMSFIGLSHISEFQNQSSLLLNGASIGYSNVNTIFDTSIGISKGDQGDISLLRPTIASMSPEFLENLPKIIWDDIVRKHWLLQIFFEYCLSYKMVWTEFYFQTWFVDKLVLNNFRLKFGGKLEYIKTGLAPLSEYTHRFLETCLTLKIVQSYGLTETNGLCLQSDIFDMVPGSVGAPLQGVKLKLLTWEEGGYSIHDEAGSKGEIHIGGPTVAKGYYEQDAKTNSYFYEADRTRWFSTGDIGWATPNGTFRIIDRKTDLVKLPNLVKVSLGMVERVLSSHALVKQCCVIARNTENALCAIIVPDWPNLANIIEYILPNISKTNLLKKGSKDRLRVCTDEKVLIKFISELQDLRTNHGKEKGTNLKLDVSLLPQRIYLEADAWTPSSGLVTPEMKLRRKEIEEHYQDAIIKMYDLLHIEIETNVERKFVQDFVKHVKGKTKI